MHISYVPMYFIILVMYVAYLLNLEPASISCKSKLLRQSTTLRSIMASRRSQVEMASQSRVELGSLVGIISESEGRSEDPNNLSHSLLIFLIAFLHSSGLWRWSI